MALNESLGYSGHRKWLAELPREPQRSPMEQRLDISRSSSDLQRHLPPSHALESSGPVVTGPE
eukprot:2389950-Prymnesium_polylepis.1